MAKNAVLSYQELACSEGSFAFQLEAIQHGKTEAIRAAVRKALERRHPSDHDVDCLSLLVVYLDPPHHHRLEAAAIADIRAEEKLLSALCGHYEKRVPELRERWRDRDWNPERQMEPVPASRGRGIEDHQAVFGIAVLRRLDLLEHSLSLNGTIQTHDAYCMTLESLTRLYRCRVPARADARGNPTPLFPDDVVFTIMYRTLAECGIRGADRRYAIIAKLTTQFARSKTKATVKAYINRVKARRIPNP